MGILKVAGKVLLIPLWFIISIIGAGVKLLVHMVAIAKKILGLGIMALFIGTVICYQDWLQAAFLACMGGVLILFYLLITAHIDEDEFCRYVIQRDINGIALALRETHKDDFFSVPRITR